MPDRQPDVVCSLWPEGVPASRGHTAEDNPFLELYRPEKPTGAAVLIFPGGGYGMRAAHEGAPVAWWLNTLGITAVVVHYRVHPYNHPQPLSDAVQAMRLTRQHAKEWNIDPARVGVLGFSAGGHLASTISTHYDRADGPAAKEFHRISSRPDVSILLYPVITMTDPHTHAGSRRSLLPNPQDTATIQLLSNEQKVTTDTPPAFLFHTVDDAAVPVENALLYSHSLRAAGVPFEMHLYETGQHGVGLATNNPALKTWPDLCGNWLRARGWAR